MFVFTQGWLCLVEVILLGTCLFTIYRDFRPVLSDCHISCTGESVDNVCRIDDDSLVAFAFISVKFDFDQRNTFLLIGSVRLVVAVISRRIAAWSLTPTTSSVRFVSDGRFVKIRSRQFFSQVFTCTICSSLGPLSCSRKGRLGISDISLCRTWVLWKHLGSQCKVS